MAARAVAFVLSVGSMLLALFYSFVTVAFGCHGSDASSPPPEGSIGDLLCTWPAAALHLGLGLVAAGAPVVAASAEPHRTRLAAAFAVSSGAIATLAVVGSQIQHWNDFLFLYPALAIFVVALIYRIRQRSE
jgi:hypothetical protein